MRALAMSLRRSNESGGNKLDMMAGYPCTFGRSIVKYNQFYRPIWARILAPDGARVQGSDSCFERDSARCVSSETREYFKR